MVGLKDMNGLAGEQWRRLLMIHIVNDVLRNRGILFTIHGTLHGQFKAAIPING